MQVHKKITSYVDMPINAKVSRWSMDVATVEITGKGEDVMYMFVQARQELNVPTSQTRTSSTRHHRNMTTM